MCKIHWQIWRIHLSTPTNHDPIRHSSFEKGHSCIPIGSMYGICTNIYHNFKHGSYGILCLTSLDKSWRLQKGYDIPTICNHLHDITVISWQLVLGGWLNQTQPHPDKGYVRQMTEFHIMKPPSFGVVSKQNDWNHHLECFLCKVWHVSKRCHPTPDHPSHLASPAVAIWASTSLWQRPCAKKLCKEHVFFRTKIGMWTFGFFP